MSKQQKPKDIKLKKPYNLRQEIEMLKKSSNKNVTNISKL